MREVFVREVSNANTHSEALSFTVVCDSCLQVYSKNGSPKQRLKIILHRNNSASINDSSIKNSWHPSLYQRKKKEKREKKKKLCKKN